MDMCLSDRFSLRNLLSYFRFINMLKLDGVLCGSILFVWVFFLVWGYSLAQLYWGLESIMARTTWEQAAGMVTGVRS